MPLECAALISVLCLPFEPQQIDIKTGPFGSRAYVHLGSDVQIAYEMQTDDIGSIDPGTLEKYCYEQNCIVFRRAPPREIGARAEFRIYIHGTRELSVTGTDAAALNRALANIRLALPGGTNAAPALKELAAEAKPLS